MKTPLHEKIRRARQARGLRSIDLCRKCGISPSALSAIEGDYPSQSKVALEKVLAELEIEVRK